MNMSYWVYVLRSINFDRSYVGFTSDIENRIMQHNSGKTPSTRPYKPWKLVYSEEYNEKSDAIRRERFLKSGLGREFIKTKMASWRN